MPFCLLVCLFKWTPCLAPIPFSHFQISLWLSWLCQCSPSCVSCYIGRSSKDTRSIMLHNSSSPFFFVPCKHHVELLFPFAFLCSTFFVLLIHHGGHGCALCFPLCCLVLHMEEKQGHEKCHPHNFFPNLHFSLHMSTTPSSLFLLCLCELFIVAIMVVLVLPILLFHVAPGGIARTQ